MTTLVPGREHPALELDDKQRGEYLAVLATLVAADRKVDPEEIDLLRSLARQLSIKETYTDIAIMRAQSVEPMATDQELERLAGADLRYALIVDAVDIIYADHVMTDDEIAAVEALASRVGVSHAQLGMIQRYVKARRD